MNEVQTCCEFLMETYATDDVIEETDNDISHFS